jgi:hypothetical protein
MIEDLHVIDSQLNRLLGVRDMEESFFSRLSSSSGKSITDGQSISTDPTGPNAAEQPFFDELKPQEKELILFCYRIKAFPVNYTSVTNKKYGRTIRVVLDSFYMLPTVGGERYLLVPSLQFHENVQSNCCALFFWIRETGNATLGTRGEYGSLETVRDKLNDLYVTNEQAYAYVPRLPIFTFAQMWSRVWRGFKIQDPP